MIEISVDQSGRVFVRWHGGGPWTVLDRDGSVTEEYTALAAAPWVESPEFEGQIADEARRALSRALRGPTPPPRPTRRTMRTVNLPGGPA